MRVVLFLIEFIYFLVVALDILRAEKVTAFPAGDDSFLNEFFEMAVDLVRNLFEDLRMIDFEYLEKLVEDVPDDFLVVEVVGLGRC